MKKKVLIAATNHDKHPSTNRSTGLWLSELAHFHEILVSEGYSVDIVSPAGGRIPINPQSLSLFFLDTLTKKYYNDKKFVSSLADTLKPHEVHWEDYDVIFYSGGHGALWDFPQCTELQEIGRNIYENGGIVSAVCHGVSGLLDIRLSNGTYMLTNKFVTGYSNMEEKLAKMSKYIPFSLQDELIKRGANYKKSVVLLRPFTITNGRLVTGQNPMSTRAVAHATLQLLNEPTAAACTAIY